MSTVVTEKNKTGTFQAHFPLGQTVGLAVLLLLLFWGVTEGILRILVSSYVIDIPLTGSTNSEFDYKVSKLDRFIKENGKIDCVFIGSSQFDDGADPAIFSQRYKELSGKEISCFNFSIATMTASPAAEMAELLVKRYHPKLIIYGTSARDYSRNFGEMARPLFEDPWLMYQMGHYNLRGWLIDKSYAVRLLATIRRYANPDYFTFATRTLRRIQPNGFLPLLANNLKPEDKVYAPEYIKSAEDMLGLEKLVRMDKTDTRIVFSEVPVNHIFMPMYIETGEEAYYRLFVTPISQYLQDNGVLFLISQKEMEKLIPDKDWGDSKHLNTRGAAIYSRWMAENLYQAIQTKIIKDPF
jgi:hypothetical protein